MAPATTPSSPTYWQRLLHRWFVEYNPLYLLSAGLVLLGANLLSRDVLRGAEDVSLLGQLGVPAITELYGWALIGGAAWLTRLGLRRPAVMLGLLAAFYQFDLTLHSETSVFLGAMGGWSVAVWLVSFVAKLIALGRALELRFSRSALVVPSAGALALVVVPRCLQVLDVHEASSLIGATVFVIFAVGLWTSRQVTSVESLDDWGNTVLRRSLRATWVMWAVLFVGHVLFWCDDRGIPIDVLLPVAVLCATRFVRREHVVWGIALAMLGWCAVWMPDRFSIAALLSATVLALRAWRGHPPSVDEVESVAPEAPPPSAPYRRPSRQATPGRVHTTYSLVPTSAAAAARLFAGAIFAAYLAAWTYDWSGGPWPDHALALDLCLTLAFALHGRNTRLRVHLGALPIVYTHHLVAAHIITAPSTTSGWGILAISVGFALLLASLVVSHRVQRRAPHEELR